MLYLIKSKIVELCYGNYSSFRMPIVKSHYININKTSLGNR